MNEISEIIEIRTCVTEEFVDGVWEGPEPAARFHWVHWWVWRENAALKGDDAKIGFGTVEGSLAETDLAGEFQKVFCRAFAISKFGDEELCRGIKLEGVVMGGLFIESGGDSIDARFAALNEGQDSKRGVCEKCLSWCAPWSRG